MLAVADRLPPEPAYVPLRAVLLDPITDVAIAGVVTAELSDTHLRFRADDGLVWAVPKSLVRYGGGAA